MSREYEIFFPNKTGPGMAIGIIYRKNLQLSRKRPSL